MASFVAEVFVARVIAPIQSDAFTTSVAVFFNQWKPRIHSSQNIWNFDNTETLLHILSAVS
jgi:hypothetical protein